MKILAIDTSCDETSVAVTEGRRVLSSVLFSQLLMHKQWGGVVPSIARRNHQERIDGVVQEALTKAKTKIEEIDAIAVTYGPGLAIALEVGILKAKELAQKHNKPLIGVNHMEGHIYSCFVQNSQGNPVREFEFPYLALLISGGHTELVLFENHLSYKILGEKLDDASGEALDKAGRLLGLGYPAGPVIERLATEVNNRDIYKFTRPLIHAKTLMFSFSGLKTAFLYFFRKMTPEDQIGQLRDLASSFQEAVFDTLLAKTKLAMEQTGVHRLVVGGGVVANLYLRQKLRVLAKNHNSTVFFPPYKYLTGDNAAMIGVAAAYYAEQNRFVSDLSSLERIPRLRLE